MNIEEVKIYGYPAIIHHDKKLVYIQYVHWKMAEQLYLANIGIMLLYHSKTQWI